MEHWIRLTEHAGTEASLGRVVVVAKDLSLLPLQSVVQLGERCCCIADKTWNDLDPRRGRERDAFDLGVTIDAQVVGGCAHMLNLAR
ncbi:MAG: hypothetical protein QOJ66_2097 [Ilumatobacteraceae bacterium]